MTEKVEGGLPAARRAGAQEVQGCRVQETSGAGMCARVAGIKAKVKAGCPSGTP